MSLAQVVKWNKKHRRGTKQPLIMSVNSGFWPSHGFLSGEYWPYVAECKAEGLKPVRCEDYYNRIVGQAQA